MRPIANPARVIHTFRSRELHWASKRMLFALAIFMLAVVGSVCRIPDKANTISAPINQFDQQLSAQFQ